MANDETQQIFDALDDLLDRERQALMLGDLDSISRLLEEKERLFDSLQQANVQETSDLKTLHTKVTRNQALLDSALQGIRSVSERMATLRRVRKSLETYDSNGRKQEIINHTTRKVEKRA